ncbi:glycosyltransferase [Pleurocapsales cyanobacterium LEGE 06147]|nr:glycosyltransferase [Pleurocapsales cyanobacterium LEGE 06147]
MKQPWLSVIMPTYNGKDYLASALDSIVTQGDPEIECIVIDDGSVDATLSIIDTYSDILPLKLVQRERQGNWVANTNYALSVARADHVCFLHQDDLWLQGRLRVMKSLVEQDPQASLYLHPSLFIDERGNRLGLWRCPLPTFPVSIEAKKMVEKLLVQNFISIPAPLFKREVALKLGGLNEKLWYTADWDFWLKIAACGHTVYYPQPLAAFRVHGSSQTIRRSSSLEEFEQQMQGVVDTHWNYWKTTTNFQPRIRQIALFSTKVNTALAALVHGKKTNLWKLLLNFLTLGPLGWYLYQRDSRIWERVSARVKARLQAQTID